MNPAVLFLARHKLRRHWVALLLLGALAALVAAVAGGTLATARRTATAYDRLVDRVGADAIVTVVVDPFEEGDAVADLEGVDRAWSSTFTAAGLRRDDVIFVGLLSGPPAPAGVVDLPLVAGRRADPDDPMEVLVVERLARDVGIEVGTTLPVDLLTAEEQTQWDTGFGQPDGPSLDLEVVGIVRSPIPTDTLPPILATPAFARQYGPDTGVGRVVWLDLEGDAAGIPAFEEALAEFEAHHERPEGYDTFPEIDAVYPSALSGAVDNTGSVLVWGLLAVAATTGLAGLFVLTQAFARHHDAGAAQQVVERSLGLTRRQRALVCAAAAIPAAAVAAVGATVGVMAAGVVEPLGGLDLLEPHRGWSPNLAVAALTAGVAALTVLLAAAITAAGAARRLERRTSPVRPSRLTSVAARGSSMPVAVGVRFALEPGRGSRAVPVRSAIAGVAVGAAGVAAVLVFGASLNRLVDQPARWGVVCDFLVADVDDQEVATLIDDPRLAGVSLAHNAETDLGGRQVTTYALEELRGHVTWELHQGRGLAGDDEVVLGTRLARWLDAEVGDTVGSQAGPLTVVGVGLGPAASGELLGASALLTPATLRTVADGATFNEAYVEVADTHDRAAVAAEYGGTVEVTTVARPPEIEDLVRIDRLPVLLGVLLATLGLAGLANGVVLGRRRRGHALAVLRTIGFTPGDAARSIVVMAVVCTMAGTAIGLPVGTAIGRLVWRTTAEATAVAGDPLSPIALLLVVPAALGTALVVALVPAREAARRRPALFLREVE